MPKSDAACKMLWRNMVGGALIVVAWQIPRIITTIKIWKKQCRDKIIFKKSDMEIYPMNIFNSNDELFN